jgi:hypothetical protein
MLAGCGYSLVRYEGLMDGAQRIAIQTLQNDSDDPGLEMMMTDALRKEFLRRGAFELISDPGAADLVITGIVLPVGTAVRSYSSVVLALEYNVTMSIDIFVQRKDGTPVPISNSGFLESEIYLASSDVQVGYKNRREALRWIVSLLASRVADAIFLEEFEKKS